MLKVQRLILQTVLVLLVPISLVYSAEKPKTNGVYVIRDSGKIEVVKEKNEMKYTAQGLMTSHIYNGFYSKQFRTFLDVNDFNRNGIYIKGLGHFQLKMGKSAGVRNKFFCHSARKVSLLNGIDSSGCSGTTGRGKGRDRIITTFKTSDIGNKTKRFKPRNKVSRGHYFFWLDKGRGFSQGYPLILK